MATRAIVLLALIAAIAATTVQAGSSVNFCQGCRSILSFAQTFNQTEKRTEDKELFKNFCELYYPTSTDYQQGPCQIFVEGLFYVIDHTDPVSHCDQIGACSHVSARARNHLLLDQQLDNLRRDVYQRPDKRRGANVVCEFCEQVVQQTKTTLSDPKIVDSLRRQLDAFCEYLKVVDQDKQCKQWAQQYLEQAVEFIRNIDPLTYCRSVQLCSAASVQVDNSRRRAGVVHDSEAALPSLAAFTNFGIETSVSVGARRPKLTPTAAPSPYSALFDGFPDVKPQFTRPRSTVSRGPNCMICKTIVKEIFGFLHQNRTEDSIREALDKVCALVYKPGPKLDQCTSMVNAYTKEMIQLLMDETDPELICMLLEQCMMPMEKAIAAPRAATRPVAQSDGTIELHPIAAFEKKAPIFGLGELISALDQSVEVHSMKTCVECKLFISYLRDTLENPKSQAELRQWLLVNFCAEMPAKNLVDSCSQLVETYADVFFKAVAGSIDPQTACADLGVCRRRVPQVFVVNNAPSRASLAKPTTSKRPVQGQVCDQCVSIVTQIDEYLSSHSIDDDVSALIDKVCNKMPDGSLKNQCVFMVKAFGSEIAQAIATMDYPRQLCSKIMLC